MAARPQIRAKKASAATEAPCRVHEASDADVECTVEVVSVGGTQETACQGITGIAAGLQCPYSAMATPAWAGAAPAGSKQHSHRAGAPLNEIVTCRSDRRHRRGPMSAGAAVAFSPREEGVQQIVGLLTSVHQPGANQSEASVLPEAAKLRLKGPPAPCSRRPGRHGPHQRMHLLPGGPGDLRREARVKAAAPCLAGAATVAACPPWPCSAPDLRCAGVCAAGPLSRVP